MTNYDIDLLLAYIESQPQSAAREVESLSLTQACALLELLPNDGRKQLIRHILPSYLARFCHSTSDSLSHAILKDLDLPGLVAVLRFYSAEKQDQILRTLPGNTYGFARILLAYNEDNVGAWMNTEILLLPASISVKDALLRITQFEGELFSDQLLIVDEHNQLLGCIALSKLLAQKENLVLQKLMLEQVPSLYARSSLDHAAAHNAWKNTDNLVLLDRKNQVIGVLQHHELRRALAKRKNPESRIEASTLSDLAGAYSASLLALFDLLVDRQEPQA